MLFSQLFSDLASTLAGVLWTGILLSSLSTFIFVWLGFNTLFQGTKLAPFWAGALPALLTSMGCLLWMFWRNYGVFMELEEAVRHFFGHYVIWALIASGMLLTGLYTDKHHMHPKQTICVGSWLTGFFVTFITIPGGLL